MLPSAAELSYFLEVANTANLSHAAKNLCISQPALSRSIQQLEATIGTSLFIRHKKGMALTPAGKKILLQAKPLFQQWQQTKRQALASHQKVEGHIKIGCHSTIGLFFHVFLPELLETYPQLDIELCHHTSDIITQQVIDLTIDIGIVTNPIHYPDLIIRKISETDTTLWVGKGKHKIQDINADEAVLLYHPDVRHTAIILQKCKAANITFKRMMKVNSIEVIANLTANGCGIGLLPSCFTQTLYANKLKRIPNIPVVTDELYLIYRKEYLEVQAIKTVINTIKRSIRMQP
jgi:DNA-binding transcriptional LysR family regulator